MGALLVIVGSVSAGGALVVAGGMHLRRPRHLRSALDAHRVWPEQSTAILAPAIAIVESTAGGALLAGLVTQFEPAVRGAAIAATAVFASYTAYSAWLWRRRPGVDCGCGGGEERATASTVARAGIFGLAALAAALCAGSTTSGLQAHELLLGVLAAGSCGVIVWSLPAALTAPPVRAELEGV